MFSVSFFHFKQYDFIFICIISFCQIASLILIFLPSTLKLIFSRLLLWLFNILKLSFSFRYFFSSFIIVIKSSWLISLFNNASDIALSMLFNLPLASIVILLCSLFLLLVVFKRFYKSCSNWKCKAKTFTLHCYRCSNNSCKWCYRNATICYK